MSNFNREPIFWTASNPIDAGYNRQDREKRVMRDGRAVTVKHPQMGHHGDYEAPIRYDGEGTRWIRMVKANGIDVHYVLTCGAADFNNKSAHAQARLEKARALGWFPTGSCPCTLRQSGELRRSHFVDRTLVNAAPCQPGTYSSKNPCPHSLAEQRARQAVQTEVELERASQYSDKALVAQRAQTDALVGAANAQTEALIGAITAAMQAKSEMPAEVVELLKAIVGQKGKGRGE